MYFQVLPRPRIYSRIARTPSKCTWQETGVGPRRHGNAYVILSSARNSSRLPSNFFSISSSHLSTSVSGVWPFHFQVVYLLIFKFQVNIPRSNLKPSISKLCGLFANWTALNWSSEWRLFFSSSFHSSGSFDGILVCLTMLLVQVPPVGWQLQSNVI